MKPFKSMVMLASTVCLGVLTQASDPGKRAVEGSIQGYVLDAVTHKPIPGVTVVLQGKSVTDQNFQSDNAGYFRFAKLAPGEVTMVVEKKGYKAYKSEAQSVREGILKFNIEVQPIENDDKLESWHPLKKFMDLD